MFLSTKKLLGLALGFFIPFCSSVFPVFALASTQHEATDPAGNPVFILDIFGEDEQPEPGFPPSTFTLSDKEKQQLTNAASHWAERLTHLGSQLPVFIDVSTYNDPNAMATSPRADNPNYATELQEGLLQNNSSEALASITIGVGIGGIGWVQNTRPASIPLNGQETDLFVTMIHEIGHALGIGSSAFEETAFDQDYSLWDKHLYDHRGVQAQPGMDIILPQGQAPANNEFDLSTANLPYFAGAHVREVLNGEEIEVVDSSGVFTGQRVPGIPVNAVEGKAELSHMELKNGLMSHQPYSNYATFLELELATLQDIGYTIDRRNFYGRSIYGSNLTMQNTQGYFLRDASGTAFIEDQYNTASYGTGLHIYGRGNTISQVGNLLSGGLAGTGIRVDGENNTVNIAPGTRVHAHGPFGTGLLVAYGSGHNILHQGQLEALGPEGIGARFDFGSANNGNAIEYRGSYIHTFYNTDLALPVELERPLVNNFALSGLLSGSQAAIYISDNALVKNIDILRGAQINGNIISNWDKNNTLLQFVGNHDELVTNISFGRATGSDGMAGNGADALFNMRYTGNIIGPKGMNMELAGGQLAFNGHADVLSVSTAAGSILSGNANYIVHEGFFNNGVLAPGNSLGTISIEGDYIQAGSGQLSIEFDGTGRSDTLIVTGASSGSGTVALSPVSGYYAGTVKLLQNKYLQIAGANTLNLSSTDLVQPKSPTLSMSLRAESSGPNPSFAVNIHRPAHAYSRYAPNSNAASVGNALLNLADSAHGDTQQLLATLDFSAQDGSTVAHALPQLSPNFYNSVTQGSISTGHLLTRISTEHMRANLRSSASQTLASQTLASQDQNQKLGNSAGSGFVEPGTGWAAFVSPYGAATHQGASQSQLAYRRSDVGLLGGLERQLYPGLLVGAHLAFNAGNLKASDLHAQHTSTSVYVGVHGLYSPQEWGGAYVYGQLRAGVESNNVKRSVSIDAYKRTNYLNWMGLNLGAVLGGGYDWQKGQWNFGPTLSLEYGMVHRPALTETEGHGTSLHLQAANSPSLRSAAGANLGWSTQLGKNSSFQAQVSALWLHDLLGSNFKTSASFVGYGYQFTAKSRQPGRDSMALQAGLSVANESFRIIAQVGTEFFRPAQRNIQGNISLSWKF